MSNNNDHNPPEQGAKHSKEGEVSTMDKVIPIDEPQSVQSQASAWLAKLDKDQPSEQDLQAFKLWVNQDPSHIAAFKKVTAAWDELNLLTRLPLELEQRQAQQKATKPQTPTNPITDWWTQGRGLALASVVLLAVFISVPGSWFAQNQGQYLTAVGEQKTLTLPDGSIVQLNTNSRLSMDYSGNDRALYLLQGEAHFEVEHNPERPFNVYVGTGLVRAVGTAFTVHLANNDIGVIVTEGVVEIAPEVAPVLPAPDKNKTANQLPAPAKTTSPKAQRVAAGNAAVFNQHQVTQIEAIKQDAIEQRLAWQRGLLVFSGEPLADVIQQVSRYTDIQIVIKSEQLQQLRIGGQFQVGDTQAVFRALEKGFGLKAEYATSKLVYLSLDQ